MFQNCELLDLLVILWSVFLEYGNLEIMLFLEVREERDLRQCHLYYGGY